MKKYCSNKQGPVIVVVQQAVHQRFGNFWTFVLILVQSTKRMVHMTIQTTQSKVLVLWWKIPPNKDRTRLCAENRSLSVVHSRFIKTFTSSSLKLCSHLKAA